MIIVKDQRCGRNIATASAAGWTTATLLALRVDVVNRIFLFANIRRVITTNLFKRGIYYHG